MENVNKLRLGTGEDIKSLRFADYYIDPNSYTHNFNEWVVNKCAEVEITNSKIIIKKFRLNTWVLRSPEIKGKLNRDICKYSQGVISISGLENKLSKYFKGYFKASNDHGAGGDLPNLRGLIFKPYDIPNGTSEKGYPMMERMYTWEGCWSSPDKRDLPGVADWSTFRIDGGGHGQYACIHDYKTLNIIPTNLYDFNTMWRGNGEKDGVWYLALGLYSSIADTDGKIIDESTGVIVDDNNIIDISEDPITISLPNKKGIDPSSKEVWGMYMGATPLYYKNRTVENCYCKYGLCEVTKNVQDVFNKGIQYDLYKMNCNNVTDIEKNNIYIPQVVDLFKYVDGNINHKTLMTWTGLNPKNLDFWEPIRNWFKDNKISLLHIYASPFSKTNMTGELILNISKNSAFSESLTDGQHMNGRYFNESKIEKLVFNIEGGRGIFTIGQHMFLGMSDLKEIVWNSTPISGIDISGMFEFCGSLKSYPNKLINWGSRGNYESALIGNTNLAFAFEYSGLTEIPSYNNTNRFADDNTIISYTWFQQAFNSCNDLIKIGPVLNLEIVNPKTDAASNSLNCPNLVDVRIKDLNFGPWSFDNKPTPTYNKTNGNLPKLDAESVKYLFSNLHDLNLYTEDNVNNENVNFLKWQRNTDYFSRIYINKVKFPKAFGSKSTSVKPLLYTSAGIDITIKLTSNVDKKYRVEYGDIKSYVPKNQNSIIETNKEYNIKSEPGVVIGLACFTDDENDVETEFTLCEITLTKYYDPSIPDNSKSQIYCPSEWRDKITPEMITQANAKGWEVYIDRKIES